MRKISAFGGGQTTGPASGKTLLPTPKKTGPKKTTTKKGKKEKNGPANGEILLPTQNKQLFQSKEWEML